MERVALDLGIIQIYWYSIFIFLGILVGSMIIYSESNKKGIDKEFVVNLAFNTIIFGIIGARLYYVLFNLNYYKENIIEILEIWNGGLAIHGGILFGIICLIYNCKKKNVSILKMLDIAVVGVIIGQAIGRWGNFFNSEAYGAVTTLEHLQNMHIPEFVIKGMYILGEYRTPTFLYESILCLIGFIALLVIRRIKYIKVGQISGLYFMYYSVIRFIIEGTRADSLMLGSIKAARLASIILFIVGLIMFLYHSRFKNEQKFENIYNDERKDERFIQNNGVTEEEQRPLFIKQN